MSIVKITTVDIRPGMRVRRFASREFAEVQDLRAVGRNGVRVIFTNGTTVTTGRGATWEAAATD